MKTMRLLGGAAAAAGAGLLAYGAYSAVTWVRYGHARPGRHPPDELLDQFIPDPEIDEYHQLEVNAPAPITFAVAKAMDLQASPVVRGVFWLRAVPTLLRGQPARRQGPRGLLEETLALGFGVLAEVPDREIVVGTYTQPWHQQVTFHPLPPDAFAGFDEPGVVKIVWTLAAEPLGPERSRFVTRTRAVTTDPESRRRFRRYWAPMSAGIILIRHVSLPTVKREAERQARHRRGDQLPADAGGQRMDKGDVTGSTARGFDDPLKNRRGTMSADADLDSVPKPITPGPEMAALARFHTDVTWTGTIQPGGMGPGTPAMTATGWGKHETIQDGRWIVGSYQQDQYLPDNTFVLTWQLHWVAGWDPIAGEYRATLADNYGHTAVMRGRIDGNRLTFETIGDPPVRLRLIWDRTGPADMVWRNEMSVGGAPWSLVEEYHCRLA